MYLNIKDLKNYIKWCIILPISKIKRTKKLKIIVKDKDLSW